MRSQRCGGRSDDPAGAALPGCGRRAVLDRLVGEPPADVHPVAGFGRTMERAEHVLWGRRRLNARAYALTGAAMGAAAGLTARFDHRRHLGCDRRPGAAPGGEPHRRVGRVGGSGRGPGPSCHRWSGADPSELDASGIAAAVIESLAENSVDAVIAPAFWAAVAGAPGATAYRAINTMDAMVGRRDDRYGNFGWAAARLDDVANYVPARIFAGLVCSAVPPPGPRDHRRGPPRRAGPSVPQRGGGRGGVGRRPRPPARRASALRGHRGESPLLGDGPRPDPDDVPEAVRIADRAEWAAVGMLCLIWLAAG